MTVSRVLNQSGPVSEATRAKVLEAASSLHYYGNSVARSLRVNETRTIGVVLSDSSEMVLSVILRSIQDEAGAKGYTVISVNTDRRKEMERRAIETLMSKHIDGVILVAPLAYEAQDIAWLRSLSIPFVLLMRSCEDETVDSIMNDNFHGGYLLGDHLCAQGCRSFLFLPLHHSVSSKARMEGFRKAMEVHGVSMEGSRVREVAQEARCGYQIGKELSASVRNFDAAVCGCDSFAMGFVRAVLDEGIRIPEELLVTGYDGIEAGRYMAVPLSTVEQPFAQIGSTGAKILLERLKDPDYPVQKVMYEGDLVVRESTQPGIFSL